MSKLISGQTHCARNDIGLLKHSAILLFILSQFAVSVLGSNSKYDSYCLGSGFYTSEQHDDPGEFWLEVQPGGEPIACDYGDGTFFMALSYKDLGSVGSIFHFLQDGMFEPTINLVPQGAGSCFLIVNAIIPDQDGWIISGTAVQMLSYNPPIVNYWHCVAAFDVSHLLRWSDLPSGTWGFDEDTNLVRTSGDTVWFTGNEATSQGDVRINIVQYGTDGACNFAKRIWVEPSETRGLSLMPSADDGVWIGGSIGGTNGFLMKLNAELEIEENYGFSGVPIKAIHQCDDGRLLVAGDQETAMIVMCIDPTQDSILWTQRLTGAEPLTSVPNGILPYDDISVVIAANGGGMNVVQMTYDGILLSVWNISSGEYNETCTSFTRTNDSNFVMCGCKPDDGPAVVLRIGMDFQIPSCNIALKPLNCQSVSTAMMAFTFREESTSSLGGQSFLLGDRYYQAYDACAGGAPTNTPRPMTPTPTWTAMNTPTPSFSPTSTNTCTPDVTRTPTPVACSVTGVTIRMPAHEFHAGEICSCSVEVCNAESGSLVGYPLFVVLSAYGEYYYAPSFDGFDHYGDRFPAFPQGQTLVEVIPAFAWPDNAGSGANCIWYAALLNPAMTSIFGEMDSWIFHWDE